MKKIDDSLALIAKKIDADLSKMQTEINLLNKRLKQLYGEVYYYRGAGVNNHQPIKLDLEKVKKLLIECVLEVVSEYAVKNQSVQDPAFLKKVNDAIDSEIKKNPNLQALCQ